ncbi:MAG: FHA domain-containing protein [Gammaproteobacteria bacterium]
MREVSTLQRIVVLSADVCGSTRLYETFGNDRARRDIALCLALLAEVAERHGGVIIGTVGDEVVCRFAHPRDAVEVGREMHQALRTASAARRFRCGTLMVRVAWHFGLAEWRDGVLTGATPRIQQQLIARARAEEVLVSGAALAALAPATRAAAQHLDTLASVVDGKPLEVYRLPWDDTADVTRFRPAPVPSQGVSQGLELLHGTQRLRLDAAHPHCSIGRDDGNDIATASRFTSRSHAAIDFRHGRFYLVDNSSNGTLVIAAGGTRELVHHEQGVLHGAGVLVCGDVAGEDPRARITYRCV